VGKSNLVHFMEQPEAKAHYLPADEAAFTQILHVSCNPGSQPADSLFKDMLAPLFSLASRLEGQAMDTPVAMSPFHALREVLQVVCQRHQHRVVFILDEFESLISHQPADFFERLRDLRDAHRTTGRVAYVVITHRLPHLAPNNRGFRESKFFELLRNNIYPLPPYRTQDALLMLEVLRQRRNSVSLSEQDRARLIAFSGGHSDLLKAIFFEVYPTPSVSAHQLLKLVESSTGIRSSCEHIWTHLHPEEQEALICLVSGRPIEPAMQQFLHYRGLLQSGASPAFFSPIFQQFTGQINSNRTSAA